jgi:aspartate-semialdehyde dehydrogenase|tara:strand:- start:318 stop:1298 length:981 start_codon:yes stop_codon:yes gene_type:complete
MIVAVVGATGMVGQVVLKVLIEEGFPVTKLIPVASSKSIGSTINFNGKDFSIVGINEALQQKPDIAIFSAGGALSLEWATKFAEIGTYVIDNSSAWRMDPTKKLIVPEVNGKTLTKMDKIIPNPNCSTIQLVLVLKPLHDMYRVKRVLISTYQSITGTGVKAVQQMENERSGNETEMAYPYEIDKNCIPQCDVFEENGYTKEEMKLTNETKKILDPKINVSATAVRIPVVGGHSEAVNIEFEDEYKLDELRKVLASMPGVIILDDPDNQIYPMPIHAEGKNDVFVGRIRRDETQAKTVNLWIVTDNLRKGAATNAVQIAKQVASFI